MSPTRPLCLALLSALLMGRAWAGGNQESALPAALFQAEAAAPEGAKTPGQEYDALFSDILKTLPAGQRAQVDSAEAAKADKEKPKPDPDAAREAARAKREKALGELPPEVKARVDKALTDLEIRRKEKAAELKELAP